MFKEKLQRYSIRKLSVGAASVLVGISFLGLSTQKANAATVDGSASNENGGGIKANRATAQPETEGKSVNVVEEGSKQDVATQSAATSAAPSQEASATTKTPATSAAETTKAAQATTTPSTTTKATPTQQTKDVNKTSFEVQTSKFEQTDNNPSTNVNTSSITAKTSGSVNGDTLEINPKNLSKDTTDTKNIADSKADAKAASDKKTTDPNATDPAVKETNVTLYNAVGGKDKLTDNDKFKDSSELPIVDSHGFGLKGTFDLDKDSVKKGNTIKLVEIHTESTNPAVSNDVKDDIIHLSNTTSRNTFEVKDNDGNVIGNFRSLGGDGYHLGFGLDVTTDRQYTSDVTANIDVPSLFVVNYTPATDYSKMHGVTTNKPIETDMYINDQKVNHIKFTKTPVNPIKIKDSDWVAKDNAVNNGDIVYLWAAQPFYKVQDQQERLENVESIVKDPNGKLPHGDLQNYRAVYQLSGTDIPDTFKSANFRTSYSSNVHFFNKDNQYTATGKFGNFNHGSSDDVKQAADNLTPQQIYNQTQDDQTLVSHIGPHTWLVSINLTPKKLNKTDLTNKIKSSYLYNVDAENDAQQQAVLNNTLNNYFGDANQAYLPSFNFALNYNHIGTYANPAHATAVNVTPNMNDALISSKTSDIDYASGTGDTKGTVQKFTTTYEFWDNKENTIVGIPVTNNGVPNATGALSLTVPKGYVLVKDQPELVNGQLPTKYTIGNSNQVHKILVTKESNQKASLVFIDDSDNNKALVTKNWTGSAGDKETYDPTSDIKTYTDKGYVVVSNNYPKGGFTFDNNDKVDQNYVIHLKHGTKDTTDSAHPVNITETIHYVYADTKKPAAKDHTATKPFVKTDTTDLVTNKVIKTVWTPAKDSFVAVTSPTIKGYAPDQASIPVQNITKDSKPLVFTVTYNADQQAAHVRYIDDSENGKILATDDLTGRTGEKSTYTSADRLKTYTAEGYELVSDGTKNGIVFDNDKNVDQTYDVHLKHGVDTKTTKNAKVVTETIHYVYPGGKKAKDDSVVKKNFDHTVKTDKVTKKTISDTWTPTNSTFNEVKTTAIPGYTPDKTSIPSQIVTKDSKDIVETVTYNPDVQLAHVRYIDDSENGKVIATDDLNGRSGQKSDYTTANRLENFGDEGYELVKDEVPSPLVFDTNNKADQTYDVHLKHGVDTKTTKNAKTVKEIIHYTYPNGKKAHDDTVVNKNFDHIVKTDKVTGKPISDTWTPTNSTFDKVSVPTIPGYTPSKTTIPAQTVTKDSKDIEDTVTYTANPQTAKITYIDDDENGKVLDVDNANGKFGDPIKFTVPDVATEISQWEKLGYKLKSNNFKDGVTYGADNSKNAFEVHFTHNTSDKDEKGNPIENHKVIKETIHYVYPDGSKAGDDYTKSIVFIQPGTRDMVTNKAIYGTWTPADDTFAEVKTPTISGYTPDKTSVPSQKVTKDSKDIVETVTYNEDYVPTPDVPTTPSSPTTTPSSNTTPVTTPTNTTTPTDNQTTTPTAQPTNDEPAPTPVQPVQPETPIDNGDNGNTGNGNGTNGDNGSNGGSDVNVPNNGNNGGSFDNNGNSQSSTSKGGVELPYTSTSGETTTRPLSTKTTVVSGKSSVSNSSSDKSVVGGNDNSNSELPQTGADDNLAAKAFGLAMVAATGMVGGLWFRKRKD